MDPVLMLYDEPTSALDPQLSMEVLSVMRELSERGMTSLVVTHELSFAIEAASSIAVMYDGRIVEEGRPEEIIRSPKTAEARAMFKGRLNYVLV